MSIDLWALALTGLFAVLGYRSGAVRQLSHWIGLAAALLGAKPAAAYLGPAVAARAGWSVGATTTGLSAALLPLLFLTAALASRIVLNLLEPGDERGPLDQGLGAAVGAVKGAVIVFAALCAAVALERPLAGLHVDLASRLEDSSFAAYARAHNIFSDSRLPALQSLQKLADEKSADRKALLKDGAFKSILRNRQLQTALRSGSPAELLKDPQVQKLLEDPELVKKLERL